MTRIADARNALLRRLRDGDGTASRDDRRAAFDGTLDRGPLGALLAKVAGRASEITDADFDAAKAELTEDQLFELVVCAAVGQSNRQYEAALAALAKA